MRRYFALRALATIVWDGMRAEPLLALATTLVPFVAACLSFARGDWSAGGGQLAIILVAVLYFETYLDRQGAMALRHMMRCGNCRARFVLQAEAGHYKQARMN